MDKIVSKRTILSLTQIDPAPFNPPTRTTDAALKELLKSITKHGILRPLAVVPQDGEKYVLADGHRRLACAKRLGFSAVTCSVYYNVTAEELYSILNETTRPQKSYDGAYVMMHGGISEKQSSIVTCAIGLFGRDYVMEIVDNGYSVQSLMSNMHSVQTYIGGDISPKTIMDWIISYKLNSKIRMILRVFSKEQVRECVINNVPLP